MEKSNTSATFLTVFGIWIGTILALFQLQQHWITNTLVILWLTATLAAHVALHDEVPRARITAYLQTPTYDALYLHLVTPIANWPLDWRCYDWALRLAVLYPFFSMVLLWAITGQPATIGSVEFLPEHHNWLASALTIGATSIALAGPTLYKWATSSPKIIVRRYSNRVLPLVITCAFSGFIFAALNIKDSDLLIVAGAILGAVTFAIVFAGAVVGACAVSGAVAVAVIGAGKLGMMSLILAGVAGVGVSMIVVQGFAKDGYETLAYILLTTLAALALVAALAILPWAAITVADRSSFLFFGLLTLVNALTDYLSYSVTISLIRQGLKTPGWAFVTGLIDVIAAILIFALLGAILVMVVAGANTLSGVQLFPLAPLFKGLHETPMQYLWLYSMLFSTLVPTLVHLALATFSMIALPFFALIALPLPLWINRPSHTSAIAAPLTLGLAATISLALPILLTYVLYAAANLFIPGLALRYLGAMEWIARALGQA